MVNMGIHRILCEFPFFALVSKISHAGVFCFRFEGFVQLTLYLGADVHLGEFVWVCFGIDSVGQEDVNQTAVGVYPNHGACEAGVAVAVLRGFVAGAAPVAVDEGFVEAQTSSATQGDVVALVEYFDGFGFEVTFTVVGAAIEQHLQDFGKVVGGAEESSMAGESAHSVGVFVMDNTT